MKTDFPNTEKPDISVSGGYKPVPLTFDDDFDEMWERIIEQDARFEYMLSISSIFLTGNDPKRISNAD